MQEFKNFQEAVDYLDSLDSVETSPEDRNLRRVFRLDRMRKILEAACRNVGDPSTLRVVHVAGTKGKSSVVNLLSSMLVEASVNVGTFTSPHVSTIRERITIKGTPLEEDLFRELVWHVASRTEPLMEEIRPTYFETLTACAVVAFLRWKVDVAVMEIGIGGRLDCTNVLPNVACAITSVGMDHRHLLGDTPEMIAREKAGIIKGSPVVTARQKEEVLKVIESRCEETGSPLFRVGRDITLGRRRALPSGQEVTVTTWKREYNNLFLPIRGMMQHENVAVALGLLELLEETCGTRVSKADVRRALKLARMPGRIEMLETSPRIIIDGAHNPQSMENLVHHLEHEVPHERIIAVVGMAKDKEISDCLRMLCRVADSIHLTSVDTSRAASTAELAAAVPEDFPREHVHETKLPEEALKRALGEASEEDIVVVTGSFYLAGTLRNTLLEKGME